MWGWSRSCSVLCRKGRRPAHPHGAPCPGGGYRMKLGTWGHEFHENAPAAGAAEDRDHPAGGMSLRLRINLLVTVLMALFAVAVTRIVVEDTRSSIKEEIEAGTK